MNDINTILPDIKLRFNIDHPTIEECYAFGYECALANVSEEENPYRTGSIESEQWIEGWWAGFYGEEPLFDIEPLMSSSADNLDKKVAANEEEYQDIKVGFFTRLIELSGVFAASSFVGYQILDLVA